MWCSAAKKAQVSSKKPPSFTLKKKERNVVAVQSEGEEEVLTWLSSLLVAEKLKKSKCHLKNHSHSP